MIIYGALSGQTIEEYRTMKKEKEQEMKVLKAEISTLKEKIDSFPGWELGTYGTVGYNLRISKIGRRELIPTPFLKHCEPPLMDLPITGIQNVFGVMLLALTWVG